MKVIKHMLGHRASNKGVPVAVDRTGQTHGLLTVESMLPREHDETGRLQPAMCRCRCRCGIIKDVLASVIPRTKSCGCLRLVSQKCKPRQAFRRPFRQYFNIKELNAC